MVIYRASITLPDGRVIFARDYKLRAFRIEVDDPEPENEDTALEGGAAKRS